MNPTPSANARRHRLTIFVTIAALGALVAAPLAPAAADSDAAWDEFSALVAMTDLTMADLPALAPVYHFDLATGEASFEEMPWEDAFALLGVGEPLAPGAASPDEAHVVVGSVVHRCQDATRVCYEWNAEDVDGDGYNDGAAAVDASAATDPAGDAFSGASGTSFPLPSGEFHQIWGQYLAGNHVAGAGDGIALDNGAAGDGSTHLDRSMNGAGFGTISMIKIKWGHDLYLSYGRLIAFGTFTFCSSETTDECQLVEELH